MNNFSDECENVSRKVNFFDIQYSLVGPLLTSSQIEFLKWFAVVSMTVGHAAFAFGFTESLPYDISRIAFPLFAFILVYNYIFHTKNPTHYFFRLIIVAILAEGPYQVLFHRDIYMTNILFTLAAGLISIIAIDKLLEYQHSEKKDVRFIWAGWYLLFVAILIIGFFVDYLHLGIFLSISYWAWLRYPSFATFFLASCVTFALNLPLGVISSFWGISAILIILFAMWLPINIKRLNKWFFYVYYPLHILILIFLQQNL